MRTTSARLFQTLALSLALGAGAVTTAAAFEKTVMVGGAAMYPSKTIVDNAVNSKDHTTLVAAVKAAGLVDTLQGAGPFTVFAPTNAAFEKVPQATRDELMSEAGKSDLAGILTYHVVEGETMAQALTQAIEGAGEGGYTLTTVNGATLTATAEGGNVVLTDAAGNSATVTATDIDASNGVIHVIDTVLMPG